MHAQAHSTLLAEHIQSRTIDDDGNEYGTKRMEKKIVGLNGTSAELRRRERKRDKQNMREWKQ